MSLEFSDAVRSLLSGPNVAHLASIRPDGAPMSHAVWVGLDTNGSDHILVCTGLRTPKVRNVEHDPHVALSLTAHDNPYEEAIIRGVVVEVRNDNDLIDMDPISIVYTGEPFPFRGGPRVTIVIEPVHVSHRVLPFHPHSG